MLKVPNKDHEEFTNIIGDAIDHVANEPVILERFKKFMDPGPASIFEGISNTEVDKKIGNAIERMGGPPDAWLLHDDDPMPVADTYPESAIEEAMKTFRRAKNSICRTHMHMASTNLLDESPESFKDSSEGYKEAVVQATTSSFWEQAENSYIRLASYWDRVGQILDFRFFRIRQFERDGFASVMDRIHSNIKPVSKDLSSSNSWKLIRKFQTSENDDGAKWLLRRRNIVVHSLHLRAADESLDEVNYKPIYNHLEESLKTKLAPRSPKEEVTQLHSQLSQAASLFIHVINVVNTEEDKTTPSF